MQAVIEQHTRSVPDTKPAGVRYVDELRILAVYAVVTAHATIWMTVKFPPLTFNWWLGQWVYFVCFCSVPVLVMISGALLLDDHRCESASDFYGRRLRRVAVPLVFWSAAHVLARHAVGGEQITLRYVIYLVATGQPYTHLWFLYMIAGLYLVTPVLRRYVRHASARQRLFVIAVIFILANIYSRLNFFFWHNPRFIFTMFLPHIAYYLAGYELCRIDHNKVPARYLIFAVIISALYMAAFTDVFVQGRSIVNYQPVFDFFTPPIIVMSLAIFWAARIRDQTARPLTPRAQASLQWVASTTLGIYILHVLVLEYVGDRFGSYAGANTFVPAIIFVPLYTFAVCYLIVSVLMNIPVLRRTVG